MEVINKIFKPGNNIKLNGWIRDIDKIKEKFGDGIKINNMKLTLNIYWQNSSYFDVAIIQTLLYMLSIILPQVSIFIGGVSTGLTWVYLFAKFSLPPFIKLLLMLNINVTAGVYTFNILYSYINGYWRPIGCTLP